MAPGYWGAPSATIDWCEDNYAVTRFIAEFCKYTTLCFISPNIYVHLVNDFRVAR